MEPESVEFYEVQPKPRLIVGLGRTTSVVVAVVFLVWITFHLIHGEVAFALVTVAAVLTVVVPKDDRAVVAVSRFGDAVRLLPPRPCLSLLPLAGRTSLPRSGAAAIVSVPVSLPSAQGGSDGWRAELQLSGHGRLPLDAAAIRGDGWEAAWQRWLGARLELTESEVAATLRSDRRWREIFPDSARVEAPDLAPRLAPGFDAVELQSARLRMISVKRSPRPYRVLVRRMV